MGVNRERQPYKYGAAQIWSRANVGPRDGLARCCIYITLVTFYTQKTRVMLAIWIRRDQYPFIHLGLNVCRGVVNTNNDHKKTKRRNKQI